MVIVSLGLLPKAVMVMEFTEANRTAVTVAAVHVDPYTFAEKLVVVEVLVESLFLQLNEISIKVASKETNSIFFMGDVFLFNKLYL